MSWPVISRQRALREGHPTVKVGDACWYVPHVGLHEYGPVAVPVRLLGACRPVRTYVGGERKVSAVSVELLTDVLAGVDGEARWAGQVVRVPRREVGPDALRDHADDRASDPERRNAYGMRPTPPKWAQDLFCPIHGYVHGYIDVTPTRLCGGEPRPAPPLPGDAARLASSRAPGMPELKTGDIGVLEGLVGRPIIEGTSITFRPRTFRDDHVVQCGGGPGTIWTPVEELTRTSGTVTLTAWEWRDGFTGRDNGIDYSVTVPVWDWHPLGVKLD